MQAPEPIVSLDLKSLAISKTPSLLDIVSVILCLSLVSDLKYPFSSNEQKLVSPPTFNI